MEGYDNLNNKNICDKAFLATKDFLIDLFSRF
jgi:hypothetical protein